MADVQEGFWSISVRLRAGRAMLVENGRFISHHVSKGRSDRVAHNVTGYSTHIDRLRSPSVCVNCGRGAELTPREREVLRFIADGLANREIGRRLGITERTVKSHVSRILFKLGVDSRLQAGLAAHHNSDLLLNEGRSTKGR